MNPNENNGRKIKGIIWADRPAFWAQKHDIGNLVFCSTYHGDRDEHWVVELKDGKEVARHNPRYIESIIWQ